MIATTLPEIVNPGLLPDGRQYPHPDAKADRNNDRQQRQLEGHRKAPGELQQDGLLGPQRTPQVPRSTPPIQAKYCS